MESSLVPIRHMLSNRNVTLLKMDIDFNEGDLFHAVVDMIKAHETSVETILIEAGDTKVGGGKQYEWDCGRGGGKISKLQNAGEPPWRSI